MRSMLTAGEEHEKQYPYVPFEFAARFPYKTLGIELLFANFILSTSSFVINLAL